MANFKKSFNFRNGVQVDNDNFVVNSNGLVGIGTSVPTEALDVIGNVDVDGLFNTPLATIGVSTITYVVADNVNVGGAVTANTFFGSAAGLTDIYAIAVDGWYITGTGHISTTSSVSVGLDQPDNADAQFTVGSDVSIGATVRLRDNHIILNSFNGSENTSDITNDPKQSGLGFDVRFDNNGTSVLGALINGNYDIDKCDLHFNVREDLNSNFPVVPAMSITTDQNIGVNTDNPTSALYVYGDGYYTGVVTARSYYADDIFATTVTGNLIGIANTALDVDDDANITINSVNSGFSTTGISTVHDLLYVESDIGVGTEVPSTDIHVSRTEDAGIQVTAVNSVATVTVGRSANATTASGQLRFGNDDGSFPSSTTDSFDLINYDDGNINFYLNPGGSGTGVFNWFAPGLSNIMTLNQEGYLGLDDNNPDVLLSVNGNARITGIATIQDLKIGNTVNVANDLVVESFVGVSTNAVPTAYNLQVGANPQTLSGVGLHQNGNIRGSGNLEMNGSLAGSSLLINGQVTIANGGNLTANDISAQNITATSVNAGTYGDINATKINLSSGGVNAPAGVGTFASINVNSFGSLNPTEINLQTPGNISGAGIITATQFDTGNYALSQNGLSNGTYPLSFAFSDNYGEGGIELSLDTGVLEPAFEGIKFETDGTDLIITVIGVGTATIALT